MKTLLKLALPTSAMYLGLMLMGLVDLLFVGRLGAVQLGGMGLGNSIFSWVMTIGIGMIFGLDYPTAYAIGSGDRPKAYRVFAQGLHLSWMLAVPAILLTVAVATLLDRFGLNAEVVPFAKRYLLWTAISYFPVFVFNSARSYLQAQSIATPTFIVLIAANLLNVGLCAGFIEGRFGFPNLGYDGLAVATVIGRFAMAAALWGYIFYREFRSRHAFSTLERDRIRAEGGLSISPSILGEVLRLGVPSSAQMMIEVGVFSLATALAAKFAAIDLAAHQIVLNTASLLFMIPLGISSATGSLVGQALGAGDFAGGRKIGNSALLLGFIFALCSSTLLIVFAEPALGVYTHDAEVIESAKRLLFVAALFQISDGAQVIATGAIRGLGNTVAAAIANGVGHWLVGLPLGLLLGFTFGYGVYGVWIGLATGLTVVAVLLLWIWWRSSERGVVPKFGVGNST
jgi:MATE family multidrug resistance protein